MSIAKNYIYNMIYQLASIILPIITIPYISRVLGSAGVGINAYTNSIIQYFVLLGTIGIALYGNREIAYVRDDKEKLSKTFWGIFYLQLTTTFVSYLIFLVFWWISAEYHYIFLIQSIYIIAAAFDISWLFMGLEDFKKTVMRNLLIKVLGVICTYAFVNHPEDLWKYIFILSFSQMLGNISLWFYLPSTVMKINITKYDIKKHLIPSISLFIPQIAIQIYVVLNKTMLGSMSNANEVGYFDNADKLVKVFLSIVTAMGTVMLPRVSNTFARGNMEKVKEYIYQSFDFASYLSIPLFFGLAGIASDFAPLFFGAEFAKTGILIAIISPIVVFIAWSNVIGNQLLLPTGKVRAFTLSVSFGAILNFILNLLLIKDFQSVGTAIATVFAELAVTAFQLYLVRHNLIIKKMIFSTWKYCLSGLVMYIVIRVIGIFMDRGLSGLAVQFVAGVISYFAFLILLRSQLNQTLFQAALKVTRKKLID
ncbi:MAG: flippase [Heyndrickxia coagulans]|jgi:O-antigen/teichoic acid export membrane protein|uniref:flippase n=1 Tax=Heyndrickxia coagulans TaxID=1398 RepID=UPI0004281A5E|nr:flippase [Heyndrickxia coagulans]